jgi:hypothetical protein
MMFMEVVAIYQNHMKINTTVWTKYTVRLIDANRLKPNLTETMEF